VSIFLLLTEEEKLDGKCGWLVGGNGLPCILHGTRQVLAGLEGILRDLVCTSSLATFIVEQDLAGFYSDTTAFLRGVPEACLLADATVAGASAGR
jgi:hypothetical protein